MAQTGGSSSTPIPPENIGAAAVSVDNTAAAKKERRAKMRIVSEGKRRNQMRSLINELHALMPHVPQKAQKAAVVGEAIDYIDYLEKMKATLEKRKEDLALARQAAASSSSSAPPQAAAEGMALAAAMSSDIVPGGCSHDVLPPPPLQQPLAVAAAVPVPAPQMMVPATMSSDVTQPLQQPLAVTAAAAAAPPPQQLPMAAGFQFKTWSWPNLVLNVSNGNAYINVRAPRRLGMSTMVMVVSVLKKHGIDVLTAQVASDDVSSLFNIYARVTGMAGHNPSSEEVYKLAMSEILLWLNTN